MCLTSTSSSTSCSDLRHEADIRCAAAVKSRCAGHVLTPLKWERAIFGAPRGTVSVAAAAVAKYEAARQQCNKLLEDGQLSTLTDMGDALARRAQYLLQLDPTFSIEIAATTKAEKEGGLEKLHHVLMELLPSEGQKKTLEDVSRQIQLLKTKELYTLLVPSMRAPADVILEMIHGLQRGLAPAEALATTDWMRAAFTRLSVASEC